MPIDPEYRMSSDAKGALILAAVLVVIASIIDEIWAVLAIMPLVFPLVIFAMSKIPLRYSMAGLMLGALTLPNPNEGFPWGDDSAPFQKVGWVLLAHINTFDRGNPLVSWCPLSGMDFFFMALGYIAYSRKRSRSKLDFAGSFPSPEPMNRLARYSLLATLFVWVTGLLKGGNFSMSLWQLNSVMYLPIVYLLLQTALRGPQDFHLLLKVLLIAGVYRTIQATYVMNMYSNPADVNGDTHLPYATSHADSMLFADAFIAVLVLFLEKLVKQKRWRVALLIPILLMGMQFNNRRLVWVHVLVAMFTLYLITEDNKIKRHIRRAVMVISPIVLGYVVAGWNSEYGKMFKPVRTLRSVIDAKSDRSGSSFWRELENLNLVSTLRENMIFGTGYGHGYYEIVQLPEINYALERYCPHNSILGLWAYCGYVGYLGTVMLWIVGVFYAMRAYRRSKVGLERAAALLSITAILVYVMHCWGDLGLGTWCGVFTAASALAMAAKLAVPTGSWEVKSARKQEPVFNVDQSSPGRGPEGFTA